MARENLTKLVWLGGTPNGAQSMIIAVGGKYKFACTYTGGNWVFEADLSIPEIQKAVSASPKTARRYGNNIVPLSSIEQTEQPSYDLMIAEAGSNERALEILVNSREKIEDVQGLKDAAARMSNFKAVGFCDTKLSAMKKQAAQEAEDKGKRKPKNKPKEEPQAEEEVEDVTSEQVDL